MASVSFRERREDLRPDARSSTASASTSPTASSSCWSGPRAAASRPCCACSPAWRRSAAATIAIDGKVVNDLESKDRDIAMVFQSYALYPHMTVRENMGFSLRLRKADAGPDRRSASRKAAKILNLDACSHRYPRELSGGQRQRVAMGRAIVRDPKVFLFDEPLSNLDAKLRVAMRAEIKALHQRLKTTTVYVTHDQIEAMTMADRIVVMQDGRDRADRHAARALRPAGQPVRRPVHRLAGDERRRPARCAARERRRWVEARRRCALAGRRRRPGRRRPGGAPTACGPSTCRSPAATRRSRPR